jgi:hypothetical protein
MNERDIQIMLTEEFLVGRNHIASVPNSTQLLRGEVDLLSVTKAGLVHEFEIKRTRSDYTRELKTKLYKHQNLALGDTLSTRWLPNYFWFVTLDFDIEPPLYAGWIKVKKYSPSHWTGKTHHLHEIKKAPRIHSDKWDHKRVASIARLLSFRLLNAYKKEKDYVK